jgi:acetaldehyde dehydrogenase
MTTGAIRVQTDRTAEQPRVKVAIIGSGNIGTDLMIKVLRNAQHLEMGALVGIDPDSDGLTRAARLGVRTTADGVAGLIKMPGFDQIDIVFDATSAKAHRLNAVALAPFGKRLVDLTPAAIGPYVVPAVNLEDHLEATNVNMVTCGGQATIPVVAAVSRVVDVAYAEIVASIASKSADPGTRANIDEFTETTAAAVEEIGGAAQGKAIIILNPVEPPLMMRNSIFCAIPEEAGEPGALQDQILASIHAMVRTVQDYVSGYHLRSDPQFDPARSTWRGHARVFIPVEVKGGGDYLPDYAGNLDIITAAAARVGDLLIAHRLGVATTWKSTSELGDQPADASTPERAAV